MKRVSKGRTYTNPRPGQYIMHAHSHVARAVAATDGCFALIGANQRGKAVGLMKVENPFLKNPYGQSEYKAVYRAPAPHNTCGSC